MKIYRRLMLSALVVLGVLVPFSVHAEEGGSGHYAPGANASFIDTLPGKPGLAVANFFNYYKGNASVSKDLPIGGLISAGLDAEVYSDTIIALYQTQIGLLGGYYAVGAAIPYVWLDTKGEITGPLGNTFSKSDKAVGIGDITLYPFMIGWKNGDLKYDVRLGIYAPTGDYDKGQLANVGKNYWTFEPTVSVSYIGSKTGLELTGFAGWDFNTKNDDTDYQTGQEFHLDITAAEHIPLFGGVTGFGVNGFYYQQVTGDSGSGAERLGQFKGRTEGIGPVISYITKIGGKDLVAEIKWLPEMSVENRLKGDYIWFKVGMVL
jgi:hypothetical protein